MREQFYKLARPDGWDFYTGRTINYRDAVGHIVRRKDFGKIKLCSNTCLHASRDPNQAFIGASIPCSVFHVEGKPVIEDNNKCGFKQLRVLEKLNPETVFKWRYKEACNPLNPLTINPPEITEEHIKLLKVWASVWDSVRASVWDSVGDSVGASVWDSVGTSVWDSVWASVWDSVRASVWDSVGASVWDSVGASVRASVWDSVGAYIGYIFQPVVPGWETYPYQCAVDLWKQGLIPSYDGKTWRLHGGQDAKILWEQEEGKP